MTARMRLERLERFTHRDDAEAVRAQVVQIMAHPKAWDLVTGLAEREAAGECIDDDPALQELLDN